MAEEWVRDAHNEARVKANLRVETSKALGAAEQKNQELTVKLTTEERERRSAEADLKNAQDQAEEQCKKLHYTEIELAMAKQQVADLKVELEKAKKAARIAKEAAEAKEQKSYNLKVQETEVFLAEELAKVCRKYFQEVWTEALNLASVPAASEWQRVENIYYPPDIYEALAALLGLRADAAPATTVFEQPSTTQVSHPPPEVSKGSGKAGDQGQGVEIAKEKGLAKVVLSSRTRVKVRIPSPCQRPRAQRLLPRSRMLLPRRKMLPPR